MKTTSNEFKITAELLKSYQETNDDGETAYYIAGLASGTETDRDGEEMAASAILAMQKAISDGYTDPETGEHSFIPLRSEHSNAWHDKLGWITKATVDDENQLWIEAELDNTNPTAMGLYKKLGKPKATGKPLRLGLSVAGSVKKAEQIIDKTNNSVRRRFLDIGLREMSVVGAPAYAPAFVETLTKSVNWDALEEFDMDDITTADAQDADRIKKGNDILAAAFDKALVPDATETEAEKTKRTVTENYNSTSTRTVETPDGQEGTIYLSAKEQEAEEVALKGTNPQIADVLAGMSKQLDALNTLMAKSLGVATEPVAQEVSAAPAVTEKTVTPEMPDLAKTIQSAVEVALKPLTDELTTAKATIESLTARIVEIEAEPVDKSVSVRKAKDHVDATGMTVEKFREENAGKKSNDIIKAAVEHAYLGGERDV